MSEKTPGDYLRDAYRDLVENGDYDMPTYELVFIMTEASAEQYSFVHLNLEFDSQGNN
jgi:hypothetical protein